MSTLITILFAGIFTNNLLTSKLLGIENITENNSWSALLKKCGLLSALMFLSAIATYPVLRYLLNPLKVDYLAPLVSVIIICGLLWLTFFLTKKYAEYGYKFLKENGSVLGCSTVVLGLCLNLANNDLVTGFITAMVYAIASAIGFTVVTLMFYAINNRLEDANLPECVKGLPTTLFIASFIALAFSGFSGI